jgi:hypothetical protein
MATLKNIIPDGSNDAFLLRQSLLSALASLPPAAVELDKACAKIVGIMREVHGGDWSVAIDHDDTFVLISRQLRSSDEVRS